MGMAMEFRAKREPDRGGGDSVRFSIVGLKGEKAVPVHNLSTWSAGCIVFTKPEADFSAPLVMYASRIDRPRAKLCTKA